MSYKLFLDDERNPIETNWIIVRSYKEFCKALRKGPPELISFDHDLGEFKTGADCAKYLIDMDLNVWQSRWNGKFEVHSQNPIGRLNIEFDLKCYLRVRSSLL